MLHLVASRRHLNHNTKASPALLCICRRCTWHSKAQWRRGSITATRCMAWPRQGRQLCRQGQTMSTTRTSYKRRHSTTHSPPTILQAFIIAKAIISKQRLQTIYLWCIPKDEYPDPHQHRVVLSRAEQHRSRIRTTEAKKVRTVRLSAVICFGSTTDIYYRARPNAASSHCARAPKEA